MVFPALSRSQQIGFWLVLATLTALIAGGVLGFVSPAPPRTLTLSTGAPDGAYQQFGTRYRELLRAEDVDLQLLASSGSVENLDRLNRREAGAAFVQGGLGQLSADTAVAEETTHLRTLATVAHEPVWVFSRTLDLSAGLGALAGKRVATGIAGSGNARVAQDLLAAYGVTGAAGTVGEAGAAATRGARPAEVITEGGMKAARMLVAGELDALILVAAPQAAAVQWLLAQEGLMLASLQQAGGLTRRLPYLRTVTLRRGSVDPARDRPPADVTLLSTTANLVVTEDLHPALASLLLEAAQQVHRASTLVNDSGEFPNPRAADFPIAREAERFFRDGRPFLQRYLPFWAANFVQRTVLVILPLIAVLVPLFRILPPMLAWRQRRKLFRRYGELKFIERDLEAGPPDAAKRADMCERLDNIERDVSNARFPLDLSDRVYTLRQHVDYVRSQLERTRPPARPAT